MIETWNTFGDSLVEWTVTVTLYFVGGYLICKNQLSIGAVFAFLSYSSYVTRPIGCLLNIKMYFHAYNRLLIVYMIFSKCQKKERDENRLIAQIRQQ